MFVPVLLSKEDLLSPPSCSHGLLFAEEVELRRRYELFLRTAGLLLRLYPSLFIVPLSSPFSVFRICLLKPCFSLTFSVCF